MRYLLRGVINFVGGVASVARADAAPLNEANLLVEVGQTLTLRVRHSVAEADDAAVGRAHAAWSAHGAYARGIVEGDARLAWLAGRRFHRRVTKRGRSVSGRTL